MRRPGASRSRRPLDLSRERASLLAGALARLCPPRSRGPRRNACAGVRRRLRRIAGAPASPSPTLDGRRSRRSSETSIRSPPWSERSSRRGRRSDDEVRSDRWGRLPGRFGILFERHLVLGVERPIVDCDSRRRPRETSDQRASFRPRRPDRPGRRPLHSRRHGLRRRAVALSCGVRRSDHARDRRRRVLPALRDPSGLDAAFPPMNQ